MNKYKLTFAGLILSTFIFVVCVGLELDLFEKLVALLAKVEQFEFDEMIIPFMIFLVFLLVDIRRRNKKMKMENAKLNIYKAMLFSSHHILNNFIHQMNIFKITAEETPGFDKKVLVLYEEIINGANTQINSLSNLEKIDEFTIRTSVTHDKCVA